MRETREQVWSLIIPRLKHPAFMFYNWSALTSWLCSSSPRVPRMLKRVFVHVTIYIIWMERKTRLHTNVSIPPQILFKKIDRAVRDFLLARMYIPKFSKLLSAWFETE